MVATNLEYRDFSEHGKLEFCATPEKNGNKQSRFSSSLKYLCKTAVDWVNRIITILGSSDTAHCPINVS